MIRTGFAARVLGLVFLSSPAFAGHANSSATAFLVVAADRGFRGNETIEKRFAEYRERYPEARLFFMTRRAQRERLERTLREIQGENPKELAVLPLVISRSESGWKGFHDDLESLRGSLLPGVAVEILPAFGESASAAALLQDRVAAAETGRVVVVGSGAVDEETESAIRRTLEDLSRSLPRKTPVEVLFSGRGEETRRKNALLYERILASVTETERLTVVPFFLDFRADHHMSVDSMLARELSSPRIRFETRMPDDDPAIASWLSRSSSSVLPPTRESLGVVLLSHGADLLWNEEIESALAPVAEAYDTEFSFSMADPFLIQDAVDALESRGRTHVVIYRLFGLERSFRAEVESMIEGGGHRGHGGIAHAAPLLRSSAHLVTFGGIEDDPLFAEALLDRALAASRGDRENEAVLLVAHGAGPDEDDRHWNEVLSSLAHWMEGRTLPPFHSIEGVTLREDWPEPHKRALSAIQEKVKGHRDAGRRVIAVEARLNGPGPTRSLLEPLGVTVEDEGFAPHPNLSRLVLRDLKEYVAGTAETSQSARR